jgi:hypothetical protein
VGIADQKTADISEMLGIRKNNQSFKVKMSLDGHRWFRPVILATWEAEFRKVKF